MKHFIIKNKCNNSILKSPLFPETFFIFITNDIYTKKLRVKIHDKVLRGQPLIFGSDVNVPIHAPTSGWIENIAINIDPTNKNKKNIKITILPDYLDQWIKLKPIYNYKKYSSDKLIKMIYQAGIVGLGGGEFSSAKKLMLSINKKTSTLIVNAVESEPDVTSDDCLINNYMHEILEGCKIISYISKINKVLIAVQEDRKQAITKIYTLIKNQSLFKLCILKKKYPGGSSKVLIKSLTGKEIPNGKHSVDIGYLIFNVATIYAIKRAIINGEPLTERIISCLGNKNFLSGNFWIRIGTPIEYFLHDKKPNELSNLSICLGGALMGTRIYNINYSVLKKTNCISVQFQKEKDKNIIEYTCIRCSACSNVCPINLLPQQLYWYSKNHNHKETKKHYVLDCIECRACEKVCPSNIPLVTYFKQEKQILKNINSENNRKKLSFMRFHMKKKRLLHEKNIINKHYINNEHLSIEDNKNLNIFEKQDIIKNNTEKNIRKKILKEAINRVKNKLS